MKLTSTQLRTIIVETMNEAKASKNEGGPNHAAFIAKIDVITDALSTKLESAKSLEKAIEVAQAAAERIMKLTMAASAKIEKSKPAAEYVPGRSFRGAPRTRRAHW